MRLPFMRPNAVLVLLLGLMLAVPGVGRLQAQETGQVTGTVTDEQGQRVLGTPREHP